MSAAFAIIIASYLLGSIPFGLIAGNIKGVDVRHHGSGNIGATNVFRVLGKGWGIAVFLLDAAKGFSAVILGELINARFPMDAFHPSGPRTSLAMPAVAAAILGGIWAIIGHTFPVWLRFKGGKGVATSLGVIFGLVPIAALISLVVWIVVVFLTRYVSVASLAAAITVPIVVSLRSADPDRWPKFTLSAVAAFLIVWRHRANIDRLIHGTEHRFGKPKHQP